MQIYCAFLRGVNIGGKTMKMAEVRGWLTAGGYEQVSSVLASGNLIFSSEQSQEELRGALEKLLETHYGEPVHLFVKRREEVEQILAGVPYEKQEDKHVYAFVCEPGFEAELLDAYAQVEPAEGEEAELAGGYFYWQCPKGATLQSGFSKVLGRKALKERFTSRNINTIQKVAKAMEL